MSNNHIEELQDQVKIPRELAQFLKQGTYSLIIKGNTGTGKTTLALSILREFGANKNCLYISTRISPDQLFQYYPWVAKFFNQTKNTEPTESSDATVDNSMFVDARLDESGPLFERITNELMDVRAPTIIIDTWDAVGFLMDKETLMNNLRVLQTWRERAGARMIFVTENSEDKVFDFLVDGIVELRQRQDNERTVREIFLSKLRGVRINKPSYIFSVNNSQFHSYEHFQPWKLENSMYFPASVKDIEKQDLANNESYFTTGYHELDRVFGGGFPKNSTISIELDFHINAKIALAFLSKTIANFIATNNLILFHPFEKSGPELLSRYQKSFNTQKDLVTILSNTVNSNTQAKSKKHPRPIEDAILAIKKKHHKKHLLSIFGSDIVNSLSKTDSDPNVSDLLALIKSNSDLSIFISRRSHVNKHNRLSEIFDIRLLIREIDGTMFLQSETPWSQLYAIELPQEKGNGIELEPIV
jgi:KaiC/GvpD/RAD55 family RecA-like ATPase